MLFPKGLALLFLLLAIWTLAMVNTVQAQPSPKTQYSALRPDKAAGSIGITVGSSITTDYSSSWISSSGRFSFGFYYENKGFFIGIQLFASSSETVVVWTARPDLMRFTKDAVLNFTKEGFFVTPKKDAEAIPLFKFSSTAASAAMLDIGNLVVFPNSSQAIPYSDSDNIIWRSFDFPTDTILGSQILPCGQNLTSSANETDHSIGNYILNLPCDGAHLVCFFLNSADKYWANGVSGGDYSFLNHDRDGRLYLTFSHGNQKDISPYTDIAKTDEMLYRATFDPDGNFRLYALDLGSNLTTVVKDIPYCNHKCQTKDFCGVNSYCFLANSEAQCSCLPGFEYINPKSQFVGCRRNNTLPSCRMVASAIISMEAVENIVGMDASAITSMEAVENIVGMDELAYGVVSMASQEDCSNACLNDCNCDAAAFVDQNCLKLKLPLASLRKDNYKSTALIKLVGAGQAATRPQTKRKIRFAAIFKSAAVVISTWIIVIGAFLGAYWFLFERFRKEWRKWELALTEEIAPRYFSYNELFKGSNEFKQQLGKGGHGTVFKAELLFGDLTVAVAVKKLHGAETEGEREFQAEMRLIGRAYHVNLVRLIGFCHDGPSRLIVYELMSRGSLADHIFENRSRRPSWERRVTILLHAARGIHYLHSECETKIIHRDIKPENILIAEDWTTKIADFGIAKLLNSNQTRVATRTLAAGTEGYVAPECEEVANGTGEIEVTEKADVYSYGIVVLETICSKRNRDVKPSLCELVWKRYEENELWKLVDGEQVEDFELEKLVKMGLLCVQKDPNARPIMEDVVMMLVISRFFIQGKGKSPVE